MRVLILGGTGLLGTALIREAKRLGHQPISAARTGADQNLDISNSQALQSILGDAKPDYVINAAANVNLAACEADPELAMKINAEPARILARWSLDTGKAFTQISTDHLFDGDGQMAHDETAKVTICNVYASSKLTGEAYALKAKKALVVRTSLAGFHADGRGFASWAMDALENHKSLVLFDDFYGSTIDLGSFGAALFQLIKQNETGLLNLASRQVFSKKEFICRLAEKLDIDLDWAHTGSVQKLVPRRARSLGLDVQKAENMLGYRLPDLDEICTNLVTEWKTQR